MTIDLTASIAETVGVEASLRTMTFPAPLEIYSVTKPDLVTDPSYSPDGTTIIFVETIGVTTYSISTITIGATVVYTNVYEGALPFSHPTFSQDMFFILFAEQTLAPDMANPQGQWALRYMQADGNNTVTILDDGNANINPVWVTPTQIAFQHWDYGATPGSAWQISLIDVAGQGRMDLGEGEYPRTVVM